MEQVKVTDNYTVFKKKNGRFGVKASNRKWINGDEKAKILLSEGLIKAPVAKKAPEPEAVEAPAEETAEAETEEKAGE